MIVNSRLDRAELVDLQVPMRHTRLVNSGQRPTVDAELASPISASEYTAPRLTNFLVPRTEELFPYLQQVIGAQLRRARDVALSDQGLGNYGIRLG